MLYLRFLSGRNTAHQSKPRLRSRVTKGPLNRCQNMPFHLNKGRLVVSIMAVVDEILDGWNSFFGIFEFSGNPKSGASDKLIVLDVHDSAGNIAIDNVQGQI